ncbi:dihydrofolate reductase [Kosakonia cowanii]|uniref:Dihydrofolate reductase n=1 Tax=Kosakonia cowanii JCM 10956 = DSM 18146 TaxID=1300165 RepID=A0A807LD07_9ENTR|nr:dihydrofolate reductase [Kosakonia cowanii] [Kosakonia cowanii JCM 10956 = DSM 18146]
MAVRRCAGSPPAEQKFFFFFTLRTVDERLCFPYSGDNFLHPGNE